MKGKYIHFFCILAVIFLFLVPLTAAAEDTIKLGAVDAYSGTFKDIGERYLDGIKYAVKVINDGGGLLGRKVEVIPIDSELKADVTTRKGQSAIMKDGIKFFSGGCGSAVGAAMIQLAERHNVLYYTFGQDAAGLTKEKCSKNFFRPGGNTDTRSYSLALLIAKKGYRRVGYIAQDYSFGV